MPRVWTNGTFLNYDDTGKGEPVIMIMGSGTRGRAWHLYQVPALTRAGYRVITFDNRGTPPSSVGGDGFTVDDLVSDVAGLAEHLRLRRFRVVGTSLGAYVAQELALARPDIVQQAALIATRGRVDVLRAALTAADLALRDSGVTLPPVYRAVVEATRNLSPRTLSDDGQIADWLQILELAPHPGGVGERIQASLDPPPGRLAAYAAITVPCQVIAFADDLVTPAHLGREVAAAIAGAAFEIVPDCGHYGYLEDPGTVNKLIIEFFRSVGD